MNAGRLRELLADVPDHVQVFALSPTYDYEGEWTLLAPIEDVDKWHADGVALIGGAGVHEPA